MDEQLSASQVSISIPGNMNASEKAEFLKGKESARNRKQAKQDYLDKLRE